MEITKNRQDPLDNAYTIVYYSDMKKQKAPPKDVVCARVPEKVKEALEHHALKKGLGLSEYVRWVLMDHVENLEKKN